MKLYYVTNNELKVKLANYIFKDLDVEVIQEKFETPEIQSIDCEEVSKYSAKYAADALNKPVMKNDSGLCFEALDGFPGALARFAEDTIKAEGFVRLLEGKSHNCYWVEVLSYCEPGKEPVAFTSISKGRAATEVHEGRGYDYDKIFIPDGDTRTFSEMSEEEQIKTFDNDAYLKLLDYLKENKKDQ